QPWRSTATLRSVPRQRNIRAPSRLGDVNGRGLGADWCWEVNMANALMEFSNELARAVEHGGRAVVAVPEGGRSGVSGTLWREGVVVAAEHTIRGRDAVTIVLPSGETTSANVTGRDPSTDIAVLKSSGVVSALPEFADAAQLKAGNVVLALGRRENGL